MILSSHCRLLLGEGLSIELVVLFQRCVLWVLSLYGRFVRVQFIKKIYKFYRKNIKKYNTIIYIIFTNILISNNYHLYNKFSSLKYIC